MTNIILWVSILVISMIYHSLTVAQHVIGLRAESHSKANKIGYNIHFLVYNCGYCEFENFSRVK